MIYGIIIALVLANMYCLYNEVCLIRLRNEYIAINKKAIQDLDRISDELEKLRQ